MTVKKTKSKETQIVFRVTNNELQKIEEHREKIYHNSISVHAMAKLLVFDAITPKQIKD
jgi:hypothetical protein